jgi:N6-L-threonylcarbamoyladenine synthase
MKNFFNFFLTRTKKLFSFKKTINILGIETSCDDTGIAIVNSNKEIIDEILITHSQIIEKYGGVHPTVLFFI